MKVERYRRTATPAAVLLLTFIGAVIASRKNRGGSGMHMALGIVIAALFILSDRFSTVFATKGNFPPFIAAWLPNIVFAGSGFLALQENTEIVISFRLLVIVLALYRKVLNVLGITQTEISAICFHVASKHFV